METLAADVVNPLLLGPGTAASEPSWVGAAANPYSARAIDHRVDAAYLSTGKDSGARSERDRSSNNIEGDISGDDSSDSTEVLPLILTSQPPSRLKLERPDLGRLELTFCTALEFVVGRHTKDLKPLHLHNGGNILTGNFR